MGRQAIDLAGRSFGPWTALDCVGANRHGQKQWRVRCRCGAENVMDVSALRRAVKQSGCAVCSPLRRGHIRVHPKSGGLSVLNQGATAVSGLAQAFIAGKPIGVADVLRVQASRPSESGGAASYDDASATALLAQAFIGGAFAVGGPGDENR